MPSLPVASNVHPLDLTCTLRPLSLGPGLFHCRICLQKVLPSLQVTWHLWLYFRNKSKLFPTAPKRSLCIFYHSQLFTPDCTHAFPQPMSARSLVTEHTTAFRGFLPTAQGRYWSATTRSYFKAASTSLSPPTLAAQV